uniref:Uncharacterized protein n=1 Tax=Oryza brachyantha TaxID=4533 RepID=J3MFH8_ORYBR
PREEAPCTPGGVLCQLLFVVSFHDSVSVTASALLCVKFARVYTMIHATVVVVDDVVVAVAVVDFVCPLICIVRSNIQARYVISVGLLLSPFAHPFHLVVLNVVLLAVKIG